MVAFGLMVWNRLVGWGCRPTVWSPPTVSCEHTKEYLLSIEKVSYRVGYESGKLAGYTEGRRAALEELQAYSRSLVPTGDVEVVGRGSGR